MTEKSIEIIAPEGYEVDKERSSFEKIVFRALRDELPKRYGDIEVVGGYKVCNDSTIEAASGKAVSHNKGIFPTREEAEASIALAQLCQLRDRYNGGWKPDWASGRDLKYCIFVVGNEMCYCVESKFRHILCFKSVSIRDAFGDNFADLIETAKPLLG